MKKIIFSCLMMAQFVGAQTFSPGVGIGNDNPTRELDVSGTISSKAENDKWYFENLGIFKEIPMIVF